MSPSRRSARDRVVRSAAAASTVLLAACGHSPPTRFYDLVPTPPGAELPRAASPPAGVAQLTAVHVPRLLDRPQMVRQGRGAELAVSDQDQWGAPLGDLMKRDLAEDLLRRLPADALVIPGAPRPRGAAALEVTVLDVREPEGRLELSADWSLVPAGARAPTLSRLETVDVAAGPAAPGTGGGEPLADALSRALGGLADRIAAALASAPAEAFAPARTGPTDAGGGRTRG